MKHKPVHIYRSTLCVFGQRFSLLSDFNLVFNECSYSHWSTVRRPTVHKRLSYRIKVVLLLNLATDVKKSDTILWKDKRIQGCIQYCSINSRVWCPPVGLSRARHLPLPVIVGSVEQRIRSSLSIQHKTQDVLCFLPKIKSNILQQNNLNRDLPVVILLFFGNHAPITRSIAPINRCIFTCKT